MEYPHWPYLRGVVGDTLKDPTHGGRIQREIGQQLDTLGHQLVLDRVSVNLQETKRTSERRGVTHTHQAGLEVHGWIQWKQPASSVYLKTPTPPSRAALEECCTGRSNPCQAVRLSG